MGVVAVAVYLFGAEKVNPGSWVTPVWVEDITDEEVELAIEFFAVYHPDISVERFVIASP